MVFLMPERLAEVHRPLAWIDIDRVCRPCLVYIPAFGHRLRGKDGDSFGAPRE